MQLEQAFTLAAPIEPVWTAFHDVELLVDCLPGASIDPAGTPADAQSVPLLFKVKLGPIAAAFAGQGRIALDDTARTGSFAGSAVDTRTSSRIKGEARFSVQPDADDARSTRVALTVDFTITGALAQFSREGIVRALADQLSRQFAEQLQARLPQAAPCVAASSEDGAATGHAPLASATVPASRPTDNAIDLWSLLKAWLRSLWPGASRP
ncbi:SRPBCC family protein [Variovorax arabinosiphilus]|uniref:SRPBCC family protein n=1 Tax=Variovorax arabinosiphilus TaxID=3053498 RepID=UPI002577AE86|nr:MULTISPECIES: SRPBCC family protein [unclassified Variovorax]MDM0119616.1 SRPBCC family protein [Variovorax sp. J2L1-78]MDM0128472.1 SRPBCC family protein [Variovorax sp. J2L1-63]MDM0232172.1 SRPBCC family protein [Variovorax sp. J2R1-6]